jgi:hypothetical protein
VSALFDFPNQAAFNRILPKAKIYAHGSPPAKVRAAFVSQVDQIVWRYKLSPETTNLAVRPGVAEIQIFEIALKGPELAEDVLRCIDKAIPSPIFFQLTYETQVRAIAAYKRPNESDSEKWVVGNYYQTPWLPAESERTPLPVALDMGALYEQMLRALLAEPPRKGESLKDQLERLARLRSMENEYNKLGSRLRNEKQFNRKVEINARMRSLKSDLDALK